MRNNSLLPIRLCIAIGFSVAVSHLCQAAEEKGEQKIDRRPRMNVVFLDDAAEALPAGAAERRNHWSEWDARVPTFQKLLRTFIADFHKAQGQQAAAAASLYALEVSAGVKAVERDRLIAEFLGAIAEVTKRPALVLARSTLGTDQLRLVYVFQADCPPQEAAGFLAALADVAPPVFHGRIGERFGPFHAPPTIVFDPRAKAVTAVPAGEKARHRWALLEEDAYLLPHYVLHAITALHEAPLTQLAERSVEPGAAFDQIARQANKVGSLRNQGGLISSARANYEGNRLVEKVEGLMKMPGGINNVTELYRRHPSLEPIITREFGRVGTFNQGPGRKFGEDTKLVGFGVASGGALATSGVATVIGGATTLGGDRMVSRSNEHSAAWNRYSDNLPKFKQVATMPKFPSAGSRDDQVNRVLSHKPDFSGLTLLQPTHQEFQMATFRARQKTFGGSGASPADLKFGGVLFEHDNDYLVDLSGRMAEEVAEEARRGRAARGFVMGRIRYFDDLPLLWLDVAAGRNGSLPVGVPRFLTTAGPQGFGGPWSFEPLTLDLRRSAQGRLLRATVTPAETGTRVSYMPLDLEKGAPPLMLIRNGTGFEPALEAKEDGAFIWTLRHGVAIEFGANGLVDAIRSPHGKHVGYVRQSGRLVGQQTSDGRQIEIQYSGARPEAIALQGTRRAAYEYRADHWLVRARGERETWSIGYAPSGRPSRVASDASTLSLTHDEKGRLTSVESGPMTVRIEYIEGTNTVRVAATGRPKMEWLLGPISGPVMGDRAMLLTRSMAGRILQVSKGPVQGTGYTRRFTASETIALVR